MFYCGTIGKSHQIRTGEIDDKRLHKAIELFKNGKGKELHTFIWSGWQDEEENIESNILHELTSKRSDVLDRVRVGNTVSVVTDRACFALSNNKIHAKVAFVDTHEEVKFGLNWA